MDDLPANPLASGSSIVRRGRVLHRVIRSEVVGKGAK